MNPCFTMLPDAWPVRSALSDSFMRGAVPWPSRSSGTNAAPRHRRSVIDSCPTGRPSMMMLSALGDNRSPDMAVAGAPRYADDLAAPDFERNGVEPHPVRIVGIKGEIVDDEPRHTGVA